MIPIAVAAGLPALPVTLVALAGNMSTILLLIFLTGQIKAWLKRRQEGKEEDPGRTNKRKERAARIWKKYGLPGLALVSPIVTGSHLGALLAMSFGGTKRQIAYWMTISLVLWAVAVGLASHLGIDILYRHTGQEGFLTDLLEASP